MQMSPETLRNNLPCLNSENYNLWSQKMPGLLRFTSRSSHFEFPAAIRTVRSVGRELALTKIEFQYCTVQVMNFASSLIMISIIHFVHLF